jgi:transposase
MLSLGLPVEIFLCTEPADMRHGFDRLAQRVQERAGRDVLEGGLFVFFNRRRDRAKLLYWDSDGLALWSKRLESGTFQLPAFSSEATSVALSETQLALILRGIDLSSVRERKRFRKNWPAVETIARPAQYGWV